MRARRGDEESPADVVLGPCPGCLLWQVDYTDEAMLSFGTPEAFEAVIEALLQEHLADCEHLQALL